ncbi:MAG: ABC transporter permease subunit [Candidatus Hadarchaeum sp.]|uniref:ABC transporter permease n=1 Tax=Candidatus Hadarchaeum sp. TaxID=2883567 RepID=UPI003172A5A0
MVGTREIFIKELADNLGSKRFWLLFFIIYALGIFMTYGAVQNLGLQRTLGENVFLQLFVIGAQGLPSFLWVVIYIAPLLGFIFTFDTINREISSGTLGNVLSQPVHRDSLINAKFLAGVATIAITLVGVIFIEVGFAIRAWSTLPTLEEIGRILVFLLISVVYLSIWVALGLLFSVIFRREGTSALASVAVWLFFSFFMYMIASPLKNLTLLYFSPNYIFLEAAYVMLSPTVRILGPVSIEKLYGMVANPLPLDQSLLLVWSHITALVAVTFIIFAISYVKFMRQEIRAI